MEEVKTAENTPRDLGDKATVQAMAEESALPGAVTPQANCSTCSAAARAGGNAALGSPSYVYAIGHVEPHCPSLAVEKEYSQVKRTLSSAGLTDRQILLRVLSDRQYRYLVRQHCWVFSVQGVETYILVPRDPGDYDLLIQTIRPEPNATDIDLVVGVLGPLATPDLCNGLLVPIVYFDQIYSFDRTSLIEGLPKPHKDIDKFTAGAGDVFDRLMQQADNAGATDANRALNYLAVRDPSVYVHAVSALAHNSSLTALNVQLSPLTGSRRIVEVIFSYTDRQSDVVQKYFARVDVTEEFPFLMTKLSPYFDR
jgi:hypothetical protein